jgi:hypothetical protein
LIAAITLAAGLTLLAFGAATSKANIYCVPANAAGCDNNFPTVQGALNAADTNTGADEVWIYPGTYTGNFSYANTSPGGGITIEGRGQTPGETTLALGSSTGFGIALDVTAPPGSTIRNLRLTVPGSTAPANDDANVDTALYANGTNEGDLAVENIEVDGPHASNLVGVICNNCVVRNSDIDVTSDGQYGNSAVWQNGGPAHVEGSTLIADTGLVHGSPNETSTISHSRIKAHIGATTDGGFIDIDNTLIQLDSASGAVGLNFHNGNDPDDNRTIGGNLDHVTIVNGANNGAPDNKASTGIRAIADTGPGTVPPKNPETVTVNLNNSVIAGFSNFPTGRTLDTGVNNGGILDFTSDYSAYNNGLTAQTWDGDGSNFHYSLGDHHLDIEDGAGFVDPSSGDFTPTNGSPLIDAGDPADPDSGATDIDGNPRACHGTDDGVIRRDIGAFEFKTVAGDDCTYPETSLTVGPAILIPGRGPSFAFSSDKDPVTFLCSWDGQAEVSCDAALDAPDLGPGAHTLSVRAKDQFGNIDQTPATHDYVVDDVDCQDDPTLCPPATCETDPSLCPKPDTTAPKILGLKYPKKTKAAKVKVRFKSNEKGSTFRCRLGKGKWKKCKSPWKTPKLKKGKNKIAIQATDQAGNKSKIVTRVVKKTVKKKAKRR